MIQKRLKKRFLPSDKLQLLSMVDPISCILYTSTDTYQQFLRREEQTSIVFLHHGTTLT